MRITKHHVFFWRGVFSQWHLCNFVVNEVQYNCAEQFMMASKAKLFNDLESLEKIMNTNDPRQQKKIGRNVKGFNKDVWDANAKSIVFTGNKAKFEQNQELKLELLSTENKVLVEASPYDKIWGVGLEEADDRILDPANWQGTNWLGEVLTNLRNVMKNEQ